MSLAPVYQYVLPALPCPATNGKALVLDIRIQKSRKPRIDTVVGIWNDYTTYQATFAGSTQTYGDVVYANGASYPGWRCIQTNYNEAPPTDIADWETLMKAGAGGTPTGAALYWEPASNFEFAQPDFTSVFYLDQQILAQGGLGTLVRTASRQQGLINPDARSLQFLDFTYYSGCYGVTTSPFALGANIGRQDLSATDYRTVLGMIFDDPDAIYTMLISRVLGTGYDTNRELFSIGDIDYAKMTAPYTLDYAPNTSSALQKLGVRAAAEAVVNRLNTFNVRDLILSIGYSDVAGPYPFIGGPCLLGVGPPPTFPMHNNRYPLSGYWPPLQNFYSTGSPGTGAWPGIPQYDDSRALSRSDSNGLRDYDGDTNFLFQQNAMILATTSINDGLHFISLQTLLSKMFALVNFTWNSGDLQTLLTFWADSVVQQILSPADSFITSTNVPLSEIGFCYEYLFNLDPRCYFGISGTGTGAEMSMTGGFHWNQPLTDVLRKLTVSLVTYLKTTYDQTNYRAENLLADAVNPTSSVLPVAAPGSLVGWKIGSGAGIKPRILAARHVAVNNAGDSDVYVCPTISGTALPVEMGFRVRKLGLLGDTPATIPSGGPSQGGYLGDSTVDDIFNSSLDPTNQWECFQPFKGGIIDGGHIVSTATVASSVYVPSGLPSGNGGVRSSDYGNTITLADTSSEFVIVQSSGGNLWTGLEPGDIYANGANYLNGNCPGYSNSDSICFANGSYAAIIAKKTRNEVYAMFPHALPSGVPTPPTGSNIPYVIGYGAYGLDGVVCSDSAGTPAATGSTGMYFTSANIDFYDNDCFGNPMIGQTIVIPNRGIYKILNVYQNGQNASTVPSVYSSGSFVAVIQLSGQVYAGSSLEFRVGGPTPNPNSFIVGTYFYRVNTSGVVFGASYNVGDADQVTHADHTKNNYSISAHLYLSADSNATTGGTGWHGCYPISRLVYTGTLSSIDGVAYTAASNPPGDSFGTALKTFAMVQAAMSLGSFQNVSRKFIGILGPLASGTNGYNPDGSTHFYDTVFNQFTGSMAGLTIIIEGVSYTIAHQDNSSEITTTASTPIGTGMVWSIPGDGSMLGYGPLDTYTEWSQGEQQTYKAQTLLVSEHERTVTAELISTTNPAPLDDAHYPVFNAGAGSSGAGGGGGGAGGIGGGGGGSSTSATWAANPGSIALTVGANPDIPVTAVNLLTLTAIAGASSISGFHDAGGNARTGLTVINSTGYAVTVQNETTSIQQIATGTGSDMILNNGAAVTFVFSPEDQFWHVASLWGNLDSVQTLGIFGVTQNDLAIDSGAQFVRISSSIVLPTPPIDITGLAGGIDGRTVTFINIGTNPINVSHQNAGSAAANRFQMTGGEDIPLAPNMNIGFWYDATSTFWRQLP